MAGVTDQPFRQLCRHFGAGLAISEMAASDPKLWQTQKSVERSRIGTDLEPRGVQIVGYDPLNMAAAARHYVDLGAQIIDINMGCPAKKVCRKAAGSALLGDEGLVREILSAVVSSVSVPVTLKIRTGTDPDSINAVAIAQIAEQAGIQALAVHGRTRSCKFNGHAEYETIRQVKGEVGIPVIANGDIHCAEQVKKVLEFTQADGVMIGRAALGQPWIFAQLIHRLNSMLSLRERGGWILRHLDLIHQFYGEQKGVLFARKHLGWYADNLEISAQVMKRDFYRLGRAKEQLSLVKQFFQN